MNVTARQRSRARARRAFPKVTPCERCGSTARVQRHHDDISKPLEIRMLCWVCHMEWHHPPSVVLANCQVCGREFQPTRSQHSRICSDLCRVEMGRLSAEKRWADKPRTKECAVCGVTFAFKRPRERTCSQHCGNVLAWRSRSAALIGYESSATGSFQSRQQQPLKSCGKS